MMQVFVHIENNEITNKKAVAQFFKAHSDGRHLLSSQIHNKRSLDQNAYFHGPVLTICKDALREAGWESIRTIVDAKKWLKNEFLREAVYNEKTGEMKEWIKDTSELSTKEFAEFIERIAQWLSQDLGIVLPAPGEQTELFTNHKAA